MLFPVSSPRIVSHLVTSVMMGSQTRPRPGSDCHPLTSRSLCPCMRFPLDLGLSGTALLFFANISPSDAAGRSQYPSHLFYFGPLVPETQPLDISTVRY